MIAVQLLVNGLIAGSIYSLVASGFSLIYATNRFVHFAHGATVTVGAYLLYALFSVVGLNFFVSSLLTVIGTGCLGYMMHVFIYNPLKQRKSSHAILLVASIGLMIFLENLMLLLFGADVKTLAYIPVRKGMELWGAVITPLQVVIIITAFVLLCAVWIFTKYTTLGKAMRAVADNGELAEVMGINTRAIQAKSFILGSGIAGIASVLVALEQNIEPVMGTGLIIKGFTGAIIGGVSSLPGAVLGSYFLGIVENFGIWWLPSGYKDAIAFILLFVFLLIRPSGILGISQGIKK